VELSPLRFVIKLPIQKFSHSLNLSRRRSININFKSECMISTVTIKEVINNCSFVMLYTRLIIGKSSLKINRRTHSLQITSHTACKINNMTGSTSIRALPIWNTLLVAIDEKEAPSSRKFLQQSHRKIYSVITKILYPIYIYIYIYIYTHTHTYTYICAITLLHFGVVEHSAELLMVTVSDNAKLTSLVVVWALWPYIQKL
jgi:hypothetical protein